VAESQKGGYTTVHSHAPRLHVILTAMVLKLCVATHATVRRSNFPNASHKSKLSAVLFNELIRVKFRVVL